MLQCPFRLKCVNIQEAWSLMNDSVHLIWMDTKARDHTNDSVHLILMNPNAWVHTNYLCVWLKWVIFPFIFFRPNVYSILGSNYIEVFMPISIASLIEVHWRICILLLFTIWFNASNVNDILYGTPTYGKISICSYLGYWIGSYKRLLVFILFFVTH